ncbi:adhesion G-protein coupled receptor F3 [Labeo rohita]|uniref:adhesion G-protein coupled receptor F3 n=1 Tax=Labeo rohita TaxID=84645 RepID=UPI0021E2E2FA|nr:adhesion G-protein coupled receptor F3 [Labeo rohita]
MLTGLRRQRDIYGTKMKLSKGVILLFLGLFFKVAVAGDIPRNSTQVYWLELEIESSVYDNFSALLKDQTLTKITDASVTDITITTECTWNEMYKNCSCASNYTGSEDMCKNDKCCNKNCLQKLNDIAVCLPESRVSIDGYTPIENMSCEVLCNPTQKGLPAYDTLAEKIANLLAKAYSKLTYFDSLIINSYRSGSVIASYTVQFMSSVPINGLITVVSELQNSKLVTTGIITITRLHNHTIDTGSSTSITCTPPAELEGVEPKWYLNVQNKSTEITVGEEANFTKNGLEDTVNLKNISGSWKGRIKCVYTSGPIEHTASTELDIALLPEIQAKSSPQFPDCRDNSPKTVVVECKISNDTENYTVTWSNDRFTNKDREVQGNIIIYKAEATIYCAEPNNETIYVQCTFTNNRAKSNRLTTKTVEIPIIFPHSSYCESDNEWPLTKDKCEAILSCKNTAVGLRKRMCLNKVLQPEISTCVNEDLHGIKKDIEILNKGIGLIKNDAENLFKRIQQSTTVETFNSFANINESVVILDAINKVSKQQSNQWNDTIMSDFVSTISNTLNDTNVWKNPKTEDTNLSVSYLRATEETINNSNLTFNDYSKNENVKLVVCNNSNAALCGAFKVNVTADSKVVVVGFRNLNEILPKYNGSDTLETTIVSVITTNNATERNSTSVQLSFDYAKKRIRNHEMYCVFWDENENAWSSKGCKWGGAEKPELCTCEHNSAFTILMSKTAETLPYMTELTYAGLGISIVSLVLCLIIEFLVWDTVVKSDIANFRHVALVNICLCLLFAHCGFLASADPKAISPQWCSILAVLEHFFFLAVFFWMLCLSLVLLHQMIFVFDQLRKKVFLALSITVGYVCPIICVATTYITFGGKEDEYYSKDTCWLVYRGMLKGSIFSFVIPALTIVMVNLFTLVVVIMKIVSPTVSESKARDQKDVARSMIKTIVFLSPVLGLTWLLGILVLYLDLTQKPYAQIVGYSFTLLNSLQGFLILLTNCLGEKKVFDALQKRFQSKPTVQSKTQISTKATSSSITN